jgi:geranylgeranyl pyrophosphate synthase
MLVCEAISGVTRPATPAAAAMQFLFASGDVFDDIEDTGKAKSLLLKCRPGIATNVATLLLVLAESSIARLRNLCIEDAVIVDVISSLNSYYTTACIGQHLDLASGHGKITSEDEYLRIIRMKSASQIECACHIGALVATEDKILLDAFDKFGHNLGMASQIVNDIAGINSGDDIKQRKMTLPIIYAMTQKTDLNQQLANTVDGPPPSSSEIAHLRDIIYSSGAIYYSTIKVELYINKLPLKHYPWQPHPVLM